jgi:hypothetical protein
MTQKSCRLNSFELSLNHFLIDRELLKISQPGEKEREESNITIRGNLNLKKEIVIMQQYKWKTLQFYFFHLQINSNIDSQR